MMGLQLKAILGGDPKFARAHAWVCFGVEFQISASTDGVELPDLPLPRDSHWVVSSKGLTIDGCDQTLGWLRLD